MLLQIMLGVAFCRAVDLIRRPHVGYIYFVTCMAEQQRDRKRYDQGGVELARYASKSAFQQICCMATAERAARELVHEACDLNPRGSISHSSSRTFIVLSFLFFPFPSF